MLNRRHLRVKVLQSLYAFFQSDNRELTSGEKELLFSIEKVYELYLYQLLLLAELVFEEERIIEENLAKQLPTYEDLNPNRRFTENKCLCMIASNRKLHALCHGKKISWQNERELLRKLMLQIRKQGFYQEYLECSDESFNADTAFVFKLLYKSILPFEPLHSFYEEKSIYWLVDWELVNKMLIKTLKTAQEAGSEPELMDLYKDPSDKDFALGLFRQTIINHSEFNGIISAKTKNWDTERIAMMDMIIMQMAVTEILKFQEIPVKVSLNEYIELSKMYSTPKSRMFVNGVLDKLVEDFIRDEKISGHTAR